MTDLGGYFAQVLLTVGLWMAAMLLYCYLSIFIKKVNSVICTWQVLAGVALVMLVFTLVCRVGFGSCSPVEPTWSWKMNTDLVLGTYWGFFGFFPEILLIVLLLLERAIDLVFWLVVRSGNEARRNVANKGRGKFVLSGAENSGKEIKPH